jgi:hypothetical protein
MSKLRLNMMMSLDGFVAGPEQSAGNPFGIGGASVPQPDAPPADDFAGRVRSNQTAVDRPAVCSGHATGRNQTHQEETDKWQHGS